MTQSGAYIGMTETFHIDHPPTKAGKKQWAHEYGMNKYYAGVHWSIRKRDADFWHMLTRSCMNRCGVRKQPFRRPVYVSFWWNDNLDLDNHAVMGKFIVDAMKGRVIEDDTRRHLQGVRHYWHDEDYIEEYGWATTTHGRALSHVQEILDRK